MIKVTNRHFQDVPALEVVTTTHLDQPLPLVILKRYQEYLRSIVIIKNAMDQHIYH